MTSEEVLEKVRSLTVDKLPKLFADEVRADLAKLRKNRRAEWETLLAKWSCQGFDRCEALDDHVKAYRPPKAKRERNSGDGWPRPLGYDKLNASQAARLFVSSRPARLIQSDKVFHTLTDSGIWRELDDGALRAEIRQTDPGDALDPRDISACVQGIGDLVRVSARPFEWIDPSDYDARDLILFRNGILHFPSGELLPLDGRYFATGTPDFDYDPKAECLFWLSWLKERVPSSAHDTLQEAMGYYMTADNTAHRFLTYIGPTRSGKSTAKNVTEWLVGEAHLLVKTMSDLSETFGLQEIPDKRIVIIPDARNSHGGMREKALERILALTGGDTMSIPRKFLGSLSMRPTARLLIVANQQLAWTENSGALAARQITIPFPNSFEGKEDMSIPGKLKAEPGIANWASEGLKRLRANGYRFTIGEHSEQERRDLRRALSPMVRFAEDSLEITGDPRDWVSTAELFEVYRDWAIFAEGLRSHNRSAFTSDLKTTFPKN